MAINTRGFSVDVMPQFSGVDPRLVALDPSAGIRGLMQSLQLAEQVNKLKAFKEAEQYLAQVRPDQAAAANAQNQKIATLSPLETFAGQNTIPALAQAQVAQANRDTRLAPVQALAGERSIPALADLQVAQANEGVQLSPYRIDAGKLTIPLLAQAQAAQAQNQIGEIGIADATQPFRREAAVVGAQGAASRAPTEQELLNVAQNVAKIKADMAPFLATVEGANAWKEATSALNAATTIDELKRAGIEAETRLKNAQADYQSQRPDIEMEKAKLQAQRHSQVNDLYKMAQNDETRANMTFVRLGGVKVPNPDPNTNEAKPEIPLSELAGALYDEVDGKLVPKAKGALWWKGQVTTNPLYTQLLQQYQVQLERVKEAQRWQDELSSELKAARGGGEKPKEQPKATTGSAKAILDKYGIK